MDRQEYGMAMANLSAYKALAGVFFGHGRPECFTPSTCKDMEEYEHHEDCTQAQRSMNFIGLKNAELLESFLDQVWSVKGDQWESVENSAVEPPTDIPKESYPEATLKKDSELSTFVNEVKGTDIFTFFVTTKRMANREQRERIAAYDWRIEQGWSKEAAFKDIWS